MYRASPSIADRMKVVALRESMMLRKQDPTGQSAQMPAQVSPPMPAPTPPESMGAPTPQEMDALTQSGKVYESSKEALSDFEQRLTDLATDMTAHIGTIGQTRYTEGLDGETVLSHANSIMALREMVEGVRNHCERIRLQDSSMVQHTPGAEMPPMGGGLQNMPAPGPMGMPPGGMPMPGPMMGGM
tara:strand:- start:4105 stop:4662 length:558 start_codon:yes stop_codon:yes gene_type:complete